MSFTPFARWRNFTLDNLKALLSVYPDMSQQLSWSEAGEIIENSLSGYKRTAYQQACQFGIEDRSNDKFRVHQYLYTFNDDNLLKYLVFWFKIYCAPNPYVRSDDPPIILYCRICQDILNSETHSINFENFIAQYTGGHSDDIFLNAVKAFGNPIKYKKENNHHILYVEDTSIDDVKKELDFILSNFNIIEPLSKSEFFERFSYENFCKFYSFDIDNSVEDQLVTELSFDSIRNWAQFLIKYIERVDNFKRLETLFEVTDKKIKINTDDMGENYLNFVFIRPSSNVYDSADNRIFRDYEYNLIINNEVVNCKLSTQWVSTDLIGKEYNANYINALIQLINKQYADVLNIYESNGKWYLKYLKQNLKFEDFSGYFSSRFAHRYITALMSKPFIILSGNSGTGKTRIAKSFAQYLEVKLGENEKNWILVPVGADWTDNTKILGFYNPLADNGKGKYEKSSILRLIELANLPENKDIPFFIILDEMNLSHVERYFADFLSHMETPEIDFILDGYSGSLKYPKNLFIVGTVNIDETTYMFSPKVLDRANVIEFIPEKESVLDLFKTPLNSKNNILVAHSNFAKLFLNKSLDIRNDYSKLNDDIILELQGIFSTLYDLLEKCGYEFSYRTVREIRQYISAAYELTINESDFNLNSVLDEAIIQKILPKIHGSRREIGELLDELEKFCSDKKLELSFKKIQKMKGKLAKVQYASFI
jgi:hypothetical protein